MHDLSFFRANLDAIAQRLATRGFQLNVEEFRALDSERRAAITESEQLKAQKNAESTEIAKLRKQGLDAQDRQQKVRSVSERISAYGKTVHRQCYAVLPGFGGGRNRIVGPALGRMIGG